MGTGNPNKDTYFVCIRCGTTYRYLIEPVVEVLGYAAGGGGSSCCCDRHACAPTCDHCGTAMLVTNSEDVVVFIRDALRKIWKGETA